MKKRDRETKETLSFTIAKKKNKIPEKKPTYGDKNLY